MFSAPSSPMSCRTNGIETLSKTGVILRVLDDLLKHLHCTRAGARRVDARTPVLRVLCVQKMYNA